jgi:DNA helicase-2/ATP-dependent DNA helicase PcrA
MKEFRLFGPPGCGKTTELATNYVPKAVAKFGRDKVMIVSFTKTAAHEIATKPAIETNEWATAGQAINVDDRYVGTLHKICYHALNMPKIVEADKELIGHWNSQYPKMAITGENIKSIDNVNLDEVNKNFGASGDELLNILNIKRNKMVPDRLWQPTVKFFRDKWEEFKKESDAMDFTDMIEKSITQLPYAPGRPEVMFVDEAQDFTSLQLKLCRSWGQQMQHLLLVGDDDQTIFRFAGASPEAFLHPPVDKNMKTVLNQSYRVPQAILERSNNLLGKIKYREKKVFRPRLTWYPLGDPVMGNIFKFSGITWKIPEDMIPHIKEKLQQDMSIMILASCSYMLKPIEKLLRESGLPFGNRFRRNRGDWNPLGGGGRGISGCELLKSFFNHGIDGQYWNVPQFLSWAKYIKVGEDGLKKKVGKKYLKLLELAVEDKAADLHSIRNSIAELLNPNAIEQAMNRNVDWLFENVLKSRVEGLKYPIKVYKKSGLSALEKDPQITIGTIHSVKGAEADCVFLFPDFSMKADQEFQMTQDAKDSMYRVFYVGMTRARSELILCNKSVTSIDGREKMFVEL